LNEEYSIAARVRGIIKMASSPRTRTQHISFGVECKALERNIATLGLPAYAEAHQSLFGSEVGFMEHIILKAIELSELDFDKIPEALRLHAADEKRCVLHTRDSGCFGFAISHCVDSNVGALNALSSYSRPVSLAEGIDICNAEKVCYEIVNKKWSKKTSPDECASFYVARKQITPLMFLYQDHAVSVTSISSETVSLGGVVRYKVNLMSETIEEIQF
jgi:hypothetical protein